MLGVDNATTLLFFKWRRRIKMKKIILSMILLISFSMAQALEFKSFNFNDESDCAEQLGQLPVSLPYDIINPNHLAKSKEICLQAYIGDNACRKEYARQKDALGLISGIRSNHTAEQEAQSKKQCGGWLKGRRSACESFLQKASSVCYQLTSQAEQQQQRNNIDENIDEIKKLLTEAELLSYNFGQDCSFEKSTTLQAQFSSLKEFRESLTHAKCGDRYRNSFKIKHDLLMEKIERGYVNLK